MTKIVEPDERDIRHWSKKAEDRQLYPCARLIDDLWCLLQREREKTARLTARSREQASRSLDLKRERTRLRSWQDRAIDEMGTIAPDAPVFRALIDEVADD